MNNSASFVFASSPIHSSTTPLAFPTTLLSPPKQHNEALLSAIPSTVLEEDLQQALKIAIKKNAEQKELLLSMQSAQVLNGAYCDLVRGQLAIQEESKKKRSKQRLVGDGLPRLLTAENFVQRVIQFQKAAEKKAEELELRKETREEKKKAMDEWKKLDDARKAQNDQLKVQWRQDVMLWENERDRAKLAHERPGWTKPTLKSMGLFPPVPKPSFVTPPDGDSDDSDDSDNDN
ncbi:hypothetical protein C8J56DRAFT_780498 [Mycena floridula]|nr:hypothetical protein C8J56DRAFT_780498 [Mycena floridula]